MSRTLGGVIAVVGLILALISIFDIHFGDEILVGRSVIGAIGLLIAFLYTITLQENPAAQRIFVFGLMGVGALMVAPVVWIVFSGALVKSGQVILALIGLVLLFINWRMLPR